VYFDALAGLILLNSLKGDDKATESFLMEMSQKAAKLKDTKFQLYYRSVRARINWHRGLGNKELAWAQIDWVKHTSASYFFLMDVPELTKIRIIVRHGSVLQVEEALNVLEEVETFLANLHNKYHVIDIEFLKAMALLRLGRAEDAEVSFNKALLLAEKNDMIRPVIEAYRVMPSLFHHIEKSSYISHRVLARIDLESSNIQVRPVNTSRTAELSLREEEIVRLIAEGLRNKEIADQLNISTVTVKSHLSHIYRKLEVPNRTSMLRKVRELEILS
jgi:ATP/maltotriose-dependent transcriptional regulator MalT